MNQRATVSDLIAGASIASLMLPEAVAYAGIAGLPPARALLAAIAGCLAYLLVGRSRFAVVSPTSSSAAILAAALATLAPAGPARAAIATAIVLVVSAIFLAAAALRLGALSSFVSRPVLRGFAFGLAVTIVVRQLPALLGVHASGAHVAVIALNLVRHLGEVSLASAVTGLVALAGLLLLRRQASVPAALVILVGGIGASLLLNLPARGVAIVGPITVALSLPTLPVLSGAGFARVVQLTAP
ncbi:MAG: SulP family inorganic anion transporter, partial [Alphaproteobacteria bacterium]|nr:SulP family inorganic anion transporter [Alphaproteobacteria bacterium]